MLHRVEIKMPRPSRVGYFLRRKKVGFSFDNLSFYLLAKANDLKTSDDIENYVEKVGKNTYLLQQFYYAHLSYQYWVNKTAKPKMSINKMAVSFALVDEDTIKKLSEAMEYAETWGGANTIKSKKKVR